MSLVCVKSFVASRNTLFTAVITQRKALSYLCGDPCGDFSFSHIYIYTHQLENYLKELNTQS